MAFDSDYFTVESSKAGENVQNPIFPLWRIGIETVFREPFRPSFRVGQAD
jgi:hypothetical protein